MIVTYVSFGISLVINLALLMYYFYKKRHPEKRQLAKDARELLHDLTHGGSVVRISVIDPMGLMIYRGSEK